VEITKELIIFRDFLLSSWPIIDTFSSKNSQKDVAINDFIQGNWELLIETSFDVFLPSFGEGADMNGISSRVAYPNKEPTHYIVCNLIQMSECLYTGKVQLDLDGFYFEKFVNDDFKVAPPLDYVCLVNLNQERKVIKLDAVSFYLKPL
jgi:hypothetical protein